ncbi:hypothetical protein VTN77DRAFT_708 [Rasamsonia byssochlamydoides]|uniref:uncharacterized protein n=1 Tax=Rasamsonia byssochlamydoides TaxID=89139 RepID=UPI003742A560
MKLLSASFSVACLAVQAAGAALTHRLNGFTITEHPDLEQRAALQDIITWDNQSLYIRGERIMIWSGEVHPYRLPVQSLHLDVFQKVKALGFNCVSFYVDWALLEGKPGSYRADGIFALEPFFEAASQAGIYLLARPGPYINAESSGGGFPGWLQRIPAILRTRAPEYMNATKNYAYNVAATIAKAQITNGGPVILYQPENEYTGFTNGQQFDPQYMQDVMDIARAAGIVVPFINNDASPEGHDAPGSPAPVNIYGHDSYPLGFDCANPSSWPSGGLPTNFRQLHLEQSPSTPYAIVEFQGGAFDPWGGSGYDQCTALLNQEFERVFYKNNLAAGVAIMNLYMTHGGSNWGNLGYPGVYTSYDYGSAISESRNITREKYSELKLIANFIKVSPSYLDTVPGNASTGVYTDTTDLTVTPLIGRSSASSFFVVRHTDYTSQASTSYKLNLSTSAGKLTIPQLGGTLTLNGRDSKIHVTDYDVAGTNILYSTAEIFTWKQFADYSVLLVYGGAGEHHEIAISSKANATVVEGSSSGVTIKSLNGTVVIGWDVSSARRIVKVDNLLVFLLDRNSAYNYWVPELSTNGTTPGFSSQETTASSIVVKAGYLVRTAYLQGSQLHLTADFNRSTIVEIIGAPKAAKSLYINGVQYKQTVDNNGFWSTPVTYNSPDLNLPNLENLDWKYVDSLPEIQPSYDDSPWVVADHTTTNNTIAPLNTPTSLYGSDYGFNTGYLIFRGHFVATGAETTFTVHTQGGTAFGSSVWLNQTYLGSWAGNAVSSDANSTYTLPKLTAGAHYVLTIVIDNMGLDEDWTVGSEQMKDPRGILNYQLSGRNQSAITWKLTGNLGGEDYRDLVRGPLNEGGLYAERQGWHQPDPPSQQWESSSPLKGLSQAGVGFYTASFDLNIPTGWDVPLYFTFGNATMPPDAYRVQLYVNGYQFGKYVNHIGPQTAFPVPQGILNYQGTNWVALTLWAQQSEGAKLDSFELVAETPVLTALMGITPSEQPKYTKREGAY